ARPAFAEPVKVGLGGVELELGLARRGVVEREFDGAVARRAALDTRDAGTGELATAHHLEQPSDLLPDDDGRDALVRRGGLHDLSGPAHAVVDDNDVHGPGSGDRALPHTGSVARRA